MTLAATICVWYWAPSPGRPTAYAQRCLTYSGYLTGDPFAAAGNYRCSVAGPSLSHAMFAVWLALLPRRYVRFTAWCMTNWKKSTLSPPSGWRINAEYSLVCCDAQHHAGLVTEITRALSMAILDIAGWAFSISAHNCPRLNGERCS